MPAAIIVGSALAFAVPSDEASLVTQSVTVTRKKKKKEAMDHFGTTVAVAYYNETADIKIEGFGDKHLQGIGVVFALIGTGYGTTGTIVCEEVQLDFKNEDFVKSSISAVAYSGI